MLAEKKQNTYIEILWSFCRRLNMVKVEIQNVSKRIKRKQIVKNVTEKIYSGEVFGILGPNGAGKTTLIKMIMGLMKPTEGKILIEGKDITEDFGESIKNVRALIEQPALYQHLSGYDNLRIFANMDCVSRERIEEVIGLVGLEEDIHRLTVQYSLGMRQRLGIAIALLSKPNIIILDEPANGLDPEGIMELREYLQKIAKEDDVAVIVSSHILAEMNQLCERFAIMKKGSLLKVISKKDFQYGKDEWDYRVELDNNLEAIQLLKTEYNVEIIDNGIMVKAKREDIPIIIKKIINANINIYGVDTTVNPLEKLYFEIINKKEQV